MTEKIKFSDSYSVAVDVVGKLHKRHDDTDGEIVRRKSKDIRPRKGERMITKPNFSDRPSDLGF